ncbi:MAG: MarR family winged helix-turn-helix transcriptional regulator [Eubacteriales bacterium]|nr:MarR family winged helix-turn-helix transcriptional regulator [Eubacteriales bacterium]
MLSNRIRRRLHAYTAGGELSGAEGKALHFLLAQDRDVYQKDLEEEYGLRPPTVTELLKKMEQKGFLCRQPSENDARCKKIIVSGKALAYKEHVCKDLKELEKEVTEGIDEKDLDVFFRVMEQMLENLS